MNRRHFTTNKKERRSAAYTFVEVVTAIALIALLVLAVYGAIMSGAGTVRMARENLRATQVLLEKMEALRLYSWDQLNTNYMPAEFWVPYDVTASATNKSKYHYHGHIRIEPADTGATYNDEMKRVTVHIDWKTGNLQRSREMTTYVCRSGLQNYVYQ